MAVANIQQREPLPFTCSAWVDYIWVDYIWLLSVGHNHLHAQRGVISFANQRGPRTVTCSAWVGFIECSAWATTIYMFSGGRVQLTAIYMFGRVEFIWLLRKFSVGHDHLHVQRGLITFGLITFGCSAWATTIYMFSVG